MLSKTDLSTLKNELGKSRNIVITTHVNPDGDAVGSSLGLYHFLLQKKHKVNVIVPNAMPTFLSFIPGYEKVIDFIANRKKAEDIIAKADMVFVLDYNVLARSAEMEHSLEQFKGFKVLIDHHLQPGDYADITYSDTSASSTCQLIFELIEQLEEKNLLSTASANCLYTGIMTDTGSFRFESCSAKTHRIVADLIDAGAQKTFLHQSFFDTNTEQRMRLTGFALQEKLTVLPEYKTAYIALTMEEMQRFSFKKGDTEGLVNYALSIEGIQMAGFFAERDDEIKISFRSKTTFDVNTFARKHFNGGGHFNAAGGKSDLTMDETIMAFIKILPKHKVQLNKKRKL